MISEQLQSSASEKLNLGKQMFGEDRQFSEDVLNSLAAHIAVLDKDGVIIVVNESWRQFARENGADWTLSGIGVGANYLNVCNSPDDENPTDGKIVYQGIKNVLTGKSKFFSLEYPCHAPDCQRWFLLTVTPLTNADGGAVVSHFNITTRKFAEKQVEQLNRRNRNILESITDAFFALDHDWRFTYLNQQSEPLLRRSPTELLGKNVWNEFPEAIGTAFYKLFHKAVAEQETVVFEEFYLPLEGWFEVRAYPSPDGLSVYFQNINERKQAEKLLRESEQVLREADRRKDEFLATLAHELRNPLAPIRTALEVMRSNANREQMQAAQNKVERQISHIVRLVDDLLDVSRITQGKIELQPTRVELGQAIELAVETTRSIIDDAGHQLEISLPGEPVYLDADLTRLAQIFLNLLTNAAKYSEPNGKISIIAERGDNQVAVCVKDTGLGIAPDKLPHIFGMFTQIERSAKRGQGGLGIGLSLVKSLAEMHGGSVEVVSAGENLGSAFTVRLPLAAEQQKPENQLDKSIVAEETIAVAKPNRRKILVVDDNADAAEMLEMMLTIENHEVCLAFDGRSAVETAGLFKPEVCLLDIGLPDIDGYEVARQIRQESPNALLIALSGWGQEEDRRRSQEAGFDYHLVKPVMVEDINTLLAR